MRHANRKAARAREPPEWTNRSLRFVALSQDGHGRITGRGSQQRTITDLIRGTAPSATPNWFQAPNPMEKYTRVTSTNIRHSRYRRFRCGHSPGKSTEISMNDMTGRSGRGRSATSARVAARLAAALRGDPCVVSEWPWGAGTRKPGEYGAPGPGGGGGGRINHVVSMPPWAGRYARGAAIEPAPDTYINKYQMQYERSSCQTETGHFSRRNEFLLERCHRILASPLAAAHDATVKRFVNYQSAMQLRRFERFIRFKSLTLPRS